MADDGVLRRTGAGDSTGAVEAREERVDDHGLRGGPSDDEAGSGHGVTIRLSSVDATSDDDSPLPAPLAGDEALDGDDQGPHTPSIPADDTGVADRLDVSVGEASADGTPLAAPEPFSPLILQRRMRATSRRSVDVARTSSSGDLSPRASDAADAELITAVDAAAAEFVAAADADVAASAEAAGEAGSGAGELEASGGGSPGTAGLSPTSPALSDRRRSLSSGGSMGDPRAVWKTRNKHIFVLSDAGKPIFSRYGNDYEQSAIMGVVQAIFSRGIDVGDNLRSIETPGCRFVFVSRGPLYLLAICRTEEPEESLRAQLHFLYSCIVFFLSAKVLQGLERDPGMDVRAQMGGTREALIGVIRNANRSLAIQMMANPVLPLPQKPRSRLSALVRSVKVPDLVYGIVLAGAYVVSIVQPKRATHALAPSDLMLLVNFVRETSVRGGESWVPVCLPELADTGFLHAYIAYVTDDVCVVLVSSKSTQEHFLSVSAAKNHLVKSLNGPENKLLREVMRMYKTQETVGVTVEGLDGLQHFVFRWEESSQLTFMSYPERFSEHKPRKRLLRRYMGVYYRLTAPGCTSRQLFETTEFGTVAAVRAADGIMLAAFDRLVDAGLAHDHCEKLVSLIRHERGAFVCPPLTW